jgi:peptidoglycan-N-acetylglucosamine deacetylase
MPITLTFFHLLSRGIKRACTFGGICIILVGCIAGTPTAIPPTMELISTSATVQTATDTPTPTATLTQTAIPTATASPTITLSPSPAGTATLIAGPAPALPHGAVYFYNNGDRSKPLVALTFDLCQKPLAPAGFDQGIIDALVNNQAPATFFMGGDWMRTHPAETRVIASYPQFEMGNHSWDHPDDMRLLDEEHMHREIVMTQDLLYQLTGRVATLFRPPTGYYNDFLLSVVAWHGMRTIRWDADSANPTPGNSAENIAKLVHERTQNGSIVLMHANGRGWNTAAAVPLIIADLRARGFTLVTVSQLIGVDPIPTAATT